MKYVHLVKISILLLFIAMAHYAAADSGWSRTYTGTSLPGAYSTVLPFHTSTGHTLIYGTRATLDYPQGYLWLAELDSAGAILWEKFYQVSGSDANGVQVTSISESPDGNLVLLAKVDTPQGSLGVILKADQTGNVLWHKELSGGMLDTLTSVAFVADSYVVQGMTTAYPVQADIVLAKIDGATGVLMWARTYGTTEDEYGYSISSTANGGLLLTAYTYSRIKRASDYWVSTLDQDGNVLTSKVLSAKLYDDAIAGFQTADGGVLVFGQTGSFGPSAYSNLVVLKLNDRGKLVWQKAYGNPGYSISALKVTPVQQSFLFSAIASDINGGPSVGLLMMVSDSGDIRWSKQLLTADHDFIQSAAALGDEILVSDAVTDYTAGAQRSVLLTLSAVDGSAPCPSVSDMSITVVSGDLHNPRDLSVAKQDGGFTYVDSPLALAFDSTVTEASCGASANVQ